MALGMLQRRLVASGAEEMELRRALRGGGNCLARSLRKEEGLARHNLK
jgi:hypothetical protein